MAKFSLPDSHPMSHIRTASIDYVNGTVSIRAMDGRSLVEPIDVPDDTSGLISQSTFIPSESRVEVTVGDEVLRMHLGTVHDRIDRPVVYLDQKDWIDFARWRKGSGGLPEDANQFYATLATAAEDERIIIPLSSAHLSETSKRGGVTRLELAATMLNYSQGWQMRSVLALRRGEFRALFGLIDPLARDDVFTLRPEAILDMKPAPVSEELGPELGGLLQRQVWATTLVSLLMDPDPDQGEGADIAQNWAQSFRPLAEAMRGNERARQMARDLTRVRFISDLGEDFLRAAAEAMPGEQCPEWLARSEQAIAGVPALARMRELMHLRITNADDEWEGNDLNDMMFLSHAAGYADLVLGERKTINLLRRCEGKVPPGAVLHRRASDAREDLDRLLKPASAS